MGQGWYSKTYVHTVHTHRILYTCAAEDQVEYVEGLKLSTTSQLGAVQRVHPIPIQSASWPSLPFPSFSDTFDRATRQSISRYPRPCGTDVEPAPDPSNPAQHAAPTPISIRGPRIGCQSRLGTSVLVSCNHLALRPCVRSAHSSLPRFVYLPRPSPSCHRTRPPNRRSSPIIRRSLYSVPSLISSHENP